MIKLTAVRIISIYIVVVFVMTLSVSPDSKLLLDGGGGGHFGGELTGVLSINSCIFKHANLDVL